MTVEIVGQQLRIRMASPSNFKEFRTQDVGQKGRLQRIVGWTGKKWATQSWRLNLHDYDSFTEIEQEIQSLRLPSSVKKKAANLVHKKIHQKRSWF